MNAQAKATSRKRLPKIQLITCDSRCWRFYSKNVEQKDATRRTSQRNQHGTLALIMPVSFQRHEVGTTTLKASTTYQTHRNLEETWRRGFCLSNERLTKEWRQRDRVALSKAENTCVFVSSKNIWRNGYLTNPEATYIESTVQIGADTGWLKPGAVLKGKQSSVQTVSSERTAWFV